MNNEYNERMRYLMTCKTTQTQGQRLAHVTQLLRERLFVHVLLSHLQTSGLAAAF